VTSADWFTYRKIVHGVQAKLYIAASVLAGIIRYSSNV